MYRVLSSLRNTLSWRRADWSVRRSASTIRITRAVAPLPQDLDQTEYLPVRKGELFSGRYEALRSLGRGAYSIVWLARDTRFASPEQRLYITVLTISSRTQQECALKILVASLTDNNRGPDEEGVMRTLRDGPTSPQSPGKAHTCQLLDSFIHNGPNSRHICLVLEPLGLSALDVYRSFPASLPLILVQRIAKDILLGLQYVHECGIIHTGWLLCGTAKHELTRRRYQGGQHHADRAGVRRRPNGEGYRNMGPLQHNVQIDRFRVG